MENNTKSYSFDIQNKEVDIPYVFTNEHNQIHGFVPGVRLKDVIANSVEECEIELKMIVKNYIYNMIDKKEMLPFFPDEKQIYEDFDNVVEVKIEKLKY